VQATAALQERYSFALTVIDNCSTDKTVEMLRQVVTEALPCTIIVNNRNFGHIRSPYHALLQSTADATILLPADLEDPPSLIAAFVEGWEEGFSAVMAQKMGYQRKHAIDYVRELFYFLQSHITEAPTLRNVTGSGLFTAEVVAALRNLRQPRPFLRAIIPELGFPIKTVSFVRHERAGGSTKNTLATLIDYGLLGLTRHSLVPLRLALLMGAALAAGSFLTSGYFFVMKLLFWERFSVGVAPLLILVTSLFGCVLLCIGIVGEYVGAILEKLNDYPHVTERMRIQLPSEHQALEADPRN
jgi:glycosyltransferase involved in cell wall biosynthesis